MLSSLNKIVYGTESEVKSDTLPQHVAALSACLGALTMGAALGWSTPVGYKNNAGYDFTVSSADKPWVTSLVLLGAAVSCYPVGRIMDAIGRRKTMLLLALPFIIGWITITAAQNVIMLMIGRFLTGFSGGGFCVTAPTYNSEIAVDSNRGTLGSYFQLMITIGILFAYAVGSYTCIFILNIWCLLLPIIFATIFYCMPESPKFLASKGKFDKARKALVCLRGKKYNVDNELSLLRRSNDSESEKGSVCKYLKKKPAPKVIFICYAMMVFQQLSGCAVVFYSASIFADAASGTYTRAVSSIIIGFIQVVFTFISTLLVDKVGRVILLLFSSLGMCTSALALGCFFFLKDEGNDVEDLWWLPLVLLPLYNISMTLGFGPIAWMMAGELCLMEIKTFVCSTAGTLNWVLAFIVTWAFGPLKDAIGIGPVFWIFSAIAAIGFVIVLFNVPETKHKSVDEVQSMSLARKIICFKKKTQT